MRAVDGISLAVEDSALRIVVTDNGCGFVLNGSHNGGDGLNNMRERLEVEDCGGSRLIFKTANFLMGKMNYVQKKFPKRVKFTVV